MSTARHSLPVRILVVEDEQQLARHLVTALTRHGHAASACHDGVEGLRVALCERPELVVLDLGLPSLDGISLLARLREAGCLARVIVLTARGETEHRVAGLRAGADDYLGKPFAMDELIARVEALGRRAAAPAAQDVVVVSDLRIDLRAREVVRNGATIELSPREFELLAALAQEPGRVFSRGELSERVWHRPHEYDTKTVEIFVARLRRKIDAEGAPLIRTIRSMGYALSQPEA